MSDQGHFVYVISKIKGVEFSGPVKIGHSKDFDARRASIQTSCPFEIEVAYVFECPTRTIAIDLERSFHQTQAAKRLCGEWFDMEPVAAIHLLCLSLRAHFHVLMPGDPMVHAYLDRAGVLWAEKRFGLRAPGVALQ